MLVKVVNVHMSRSMFAIRSKYNPSASVRPTGRNSFIQDGLRYSDMRPRPKKLAVQARRDSSNLRVRLDVHRYQVSDCGKQ